MNRRIGRLIGAAIMTVALSVGSAWAAAIVTITREHNDPAALEITAGEEVEWVNDSGGTAHVWFGADPGVGYFLGGKGMGKGSYQVKFDKPGTYGYTVHVTGVVSHTHTGKIVVK